MIKIVVLMLLCASTYAVKYNCSAKSALLILKRPTYEFSVKLLDRVTQETYGHFVFSPISTYMQLLALAEGARGISLREIWDVTRHHRRKCFRRKWKFILNRLDSELGENFQKKSVLVLDRLLGVKRPFVREVNKLKSMEVLLLDFNSPYKSAEHANKVISAATHGVIEDTFTPADFNTTVLLTADASHYNSDWQIPFNPVYTKTETFYGSYTGEVDMMERIDYFHMSDITVIRAQVLELPCGSRNRLSMLVFLPHEDVYDVFYDLHKIRLMSIFNTFKVDGKKMLRVKLPRFRIKSDIDNLPELINDMGVSSIFYPNKADLRGISDYKVYASMMTQVADIEVDEKGVRAAVVADFMVSNKGLTDEFVVNRPFAFMLVDKKTEIILLAGVYSNPEKF